MGLSDSEGLELSLVLFCTGGRVRFETELSTGELSLFIGVSRQHSRFKQFLNLFFLHALQFLVTLGNDHVSGVALQHFEVFMEVGLSLHMHPAKDVVVLVGAHVFHMVLGLGA